MSRSRSRPRGRADSLDALLTEVVAEAWAAGLGAEEDRGWRRAGEGTAADGVRTLQQLDLAREDSRRLLGASAYDDGNEFAIGAAENRINYVVGEDGLKYEVVPTSAEGEPLAKEAQAFVDAFCELNCLAEMEAETLQRADRDGDAFIRLFDAGPVPEARFVEPECVRPPEGEVANPRCLWGVLTGSEARPRDGQTVSGYYVDEGGGEPVFVPEAEINHLKLNTDTKYPRGWPTFEPIGRALRRAEELLVAMTATGKARAKIALVESIPGLNREKADQLVSRLTEKYQHDPAGGPPTLQTVEELPYGARVRVREGTTITFPNHSLGAADLIEAMQANLRAGAARLNMPEWMFSIVADAKYSNAFVVEAPTLRQFRRIQRKLVTLFGEGRMRERASLVWRAMKMAAKRGTLNPAVLTHCRVKCTAPSIEVRDKAAEATMNVAYIAAGVKPVPLVQRELGIDPDEASAMAAAHAATNPPAGPPAPAPAPTPAA